MIDGSIGMAYGLVSTSSLIAAGVPSASASAAVHLAEVFTTGASGAAHWRRGNVDRALLLRLAIPGAVGGLIGAALVSSVPTQTIRIVANVYLLLMGLVVLARAFELRPRPPADHRHVGPLAFVGALIDAFGGGWGPVVASTLIARGHEPRRTVGSVNLTEFVVTVSQSAMFIALLGVAHVDLVAALVLGGIVAAPLAARLTTRLPVRLLIALVGLMVTGLSVRSLYLAFA
jgi:uncharacterized membrane protein YfcA